MGKGPGQTLEAKDPLLPFSAFSKMTVFSYPVCACVRNAAAEKAKKRFLFFYLCAFLCNCPSAAHTMIDCKPTTTLQTDFHKSSDFFCWLTA